MLFNYDNQVVLPLLSFHVIPQGEMKMPVCIEDECNSELPPASLLFRTARQYAYGVLFSLAETQRRLERLALRKRAPFEGGSLEKLQYLFFLSPESKRFGLLPLSVMLMHSLHYEHFFI